MIVPTACDNMPFSSTAIRMIVIVLFAAVLGVGADAPIINVKSATSLLSDAECGLIEQATALACATQDGLTIFDQLLSSTPRTVSYQPFSTALTETPTAVLGIDRNFVLVYTPQKLLLGTTAVATPGPSSIERINPGLDYFALYHSSSVSIVTQHRLSPGTYLVATTVPFSAMACTMTTTALYAVATNDMSLFSFTVSINIAGRITLGPAVAILFTVEQTSRYTGPGMFFLIRERGSSTVGGYRDIFLWDNADLCSSCASCEPCPADGIWATLTDSYFTGPWMCYPVVKTTNAEQYCAYYDYADPRVFKILYCNAQNSELGGARPYPTTFPAGCSSPWQRSPPYVNISNVTTNSLWDIPSGSFTYPNLGFSLPTFMTQQSYKNYVNIAVGNGVLLISVIRSGTDCSISDSRTILVNDAPFCNSVTQTESFSMAISVGSVVPGRPNAFVKFGRYKGSLSIASYPPRVVAFNAANGSTVFYAAVSNAAFAVDTYGVLPTTFSSAYYGTLIPLSSTASNLVFAGLTIGYAGTGGTYNLFKLPQLIPQSTTVHYTVVMQNGWFNYTENYAYCATPVTANLYFLSTAITPDGVLSPSSGLSQASTSPFVPAVLDQSWQAITNNAVQLSFFTPACSMSFTQVANVVFRGTPVSISFTMLPNGAPLPSLPHATTPAPPTPPPKTHTVSATVTLSDTEMITQSKSVALNSASGTKTLAVVTATASELASETASLSQSVSLGSGSLSPMFVTPEPTVPGEVFPVLPDNVSLLPPVPQTGGNLGFPTDQISEVVVTRNTTTSSVFVTAVALPFLGVGVLFSAHTPSVSFGSALVTSEGGALGLTLRTVNVTEAVRFLEGLALAVNPDVISRNLTHVIPVNISVWGEDSAAPSQRVHLRQWYLPIASIPLNRGPVVAPTLNCSFSVMRGIRFDVDVGRVFDHSLQLPMTVASVTGQFALPPTVRALCNSSGSCALKGVALDDTPIKYALGASDGYFGVSVFCTIAPFYVALRIARSTPLSFVVKAKTSFVLVLPDDIFISSLPVTLLGVTLAGGFPLPSSLIFTRPNTVQGQIDRVQVVSLEIAAVDLYGQAFYSFLINATDQAPMIVGELPRVHILAGRSFSQSVFLSTAVVDPDPEDTVTCSQNVSRFTVPWVTVVQAASGVLLVDGTAPIQGFPHGQNLTLDLDCTDGVRSTPVTLTLQMQRSAPPVQFAYLPNATVTAGDTLQLVVSVSDYFADATGGTVKWGIVTPTGSLVNWLQVQRVSETIVQLSGVPVVDYADDTFPVRVTAVSVFNNETSGEIVITVTATTWQLILQYSALIYSLIGLLASAVTVWLYWVPLANAFRFRWLKVECPLLDSSAVECEATGKDFSCPSHANAVRAVAMCAFRRAAARGHLRRVLRRLSCLSSYWKLVVTHDQRDFPSWLRWRGDDRVMFAFDEIVGDDKVPEVTVLELNEYDVIVRHYVCVYADIVRSLGLRQAGSNSHPEAPRPLLRSDDDGDGSGGRDASGEHDVSLDDDLDALLELGEGHKHSASVNVARVCSSAHPQGVSHVDANLLAADVQVVGGKVDRIHDMLKSLVANLGNFKPSAASASSNDANDGLHKPTPLWDTARGTEMAHDTFGRGRRINDPLAELNLAQDALRQRKS